MRAHGISRTRALGALLLLALLLSLCGCGGGGTVSTGTLPDPGSSDNYTVYFMDVGEGDSTLIVSQDKQACLVDAGRSSEIGQGVAEFAKGLGISELKVALSTHSDRDHYYGFKKAGSFNGVIDTIPIKKFVHSGAGDVPTGVNWPELVTQLSDKGIPIETTKAGDAISLGNITLSVLAPPDGFVRTPAYNWKNENSIVVKVSNAAGVSCFLGGDVENDGVTSLRSQSYNLHCSLMMAPHHGSSNGLTQALYDAITPQTAVISVGPNTYGHPTAGVLSIIGNGGAALYRTDEKGNITVKVTGATYTVETQH